jgi:MOSC domain-containing protein YiiM
MLDNTRERQRCLPFEYARLSRWAYVGRLRPVGTGRRTVLTAIWKAPIEGRVRVRGVNLDGDDQADRLLHGGPDKAVYAYAIEETRDWKGEVGRELGPGAFGENLTTSGIDVSGALLRERWRIGTTLLESVQPRLPCFKLGLRMNDPTFVKRFAQASRTGAYLRIWRGTRHVSRPAMAVRCVPEPWSRTTTTMSASQLPSTPRKPFARC